MSDITSRPYSKEGEEAWDRVFGNKNKNNNIGEVSKKCKCGAIVFYYHDMVTKKRYCEICGREQ